MVQCKWEYENKKSRVRARATWLRTGKVYVCYTSIVLHTGSIFELLAHL